MKRTRLILVALIVLLSGCAVDSQLIDWANYVCEPNGGLKEIRRTRYFFTVAVCKNGAQFDGVSFAR